MLKFFRIIIIGSVFINPLILFGGPTPPPTPPSENPHPPVTEEDKKRVAFAELAIQKLLMAPKTQKINNFVFNDGNNPNIQLNLTESCLKNSSCFQKNKEALEYASDIRQSYGSLFTLRHTHIIPWSFEKFEGKNQKQTPTDSNKEASMSAPTMPVPQLNQDEYMIHTYVLFEDRKDWYQVNVIVTEDEKGNLKLKRFFIIQMPRPIFIRHDVIIE